MHCSPRSVVCGNVSLMSIFVDRGSLVRWCQMRVRSSKMRVFFFDRYIFSIFICSSHWLYISKFICTASRGFPATARLFLSLLLSTQKQENFVTENRCPFAKESVMRMLVMVCASTCRVCECGKRVADVNYL